MYKNQEKTLLKKYVFIIHSLIWGLMLTCSELSNLFIIPDISNFPDVHLALKEDEKRIPCFLDQYYNYINTPYNSWNKSLFFVMNAISYHFRLWSLKFDNTKIITKSELLATFYFSIFATNRIGIIFIW